MKQDSHGGKSIVPGQSKKRSETENVANNRDERHADTPHDYSSLLRCVCHNLNGRYVVTPFVSPFSTYHPDKA